MVSQDRGSGRVWVSMAQEEDGAVWGDRVSSWDQEWKQRGGGEVHTGMDGALEVGAEADGAVKGGAGQHGEVGQGGPM